MKSYKIWLCILMMLQTAAGWSQECPEILYPVDGQTNVSLDDVIQWTNTGLRENDTWTISIGLTPDGEEIVRRKSTGRVPRFQLPCGIPNNETIYVTLYIFTISDGLILCSSFNFTTEAVSEPPECRSLTFPRDGAGEVSTKTTLTWECSLSATGYRLSVGTSSGTYDIFEDLELGVDELSYSFTDAPLPENEEIYVRVVPFNDEGPAGNGICEETMFRTGDLIELPQCTSMLSPLDGALNVALDATLTWNPVENATGYRVFMGTSPDEFDILEDEIPISRNFIKFRDPLDANTTYYIRIVPVNAAGENIGCLENPPERFSTIKGCTETDSPTITFPPEIGSCEGNSEVQVIATDEAQGYRWYEVKQQGIEVLLDTLPTTILPGEGNYRLEIFNEIPGPDGTLFPCSSSREFIVTNSEQAIIDRVDVQLGASGINIRVEVSGIGDYEFALAEEGPYQDSNRFTNLPVDNYTVYVNDKKGCGITEVLVEPDLTLEGFPKFFTPNADGMNDRWQFIPPPSGENPIRELFIFNRYGKLLKQINPMDPEGGWDGTFNGQPLPASDYWFRAVDSNGRVIQGHFALKR